MHTASRQLQQEQRDQRCLGPSHRQPLLLTIAHHIRGRRWGAAVATCNKLPDVRDKLEDYLTPQRADVALQLVLDELQATAAQSLLEEQQASADLPPEQPAVCNRHRRQQIDFSRLMPGTTSGIHTLKVGEDFLTDRQEIDAALAAYWEQVFTAPPLPAEARAKQQQWLEDTLQQAEGLPTPPQ